MVSHLAPPQIRARAINAHGSSFQTFAAAAIRRRFGDTSTGSDAPAMVPSDGRWKRHPLRSAGSFGRVPPLRRFSGTLRLPAAHFAALRGLRLAIPPVRPVGSHRPGRAAGGTGSWYSGSRAGDVGGNGRVSQVPERPSCPCALFEDPGRTEMRQAIAALGAAPAGVNNGGSRERRFRGSIARHRDSLSVLESQGPVFRLFLRDAGGLIGQRDR